MSDVDFPKPNDRWWLSIHGEARGPFSTSDIADRLASGELNPAGFICGEGQSAWTRISDTPPFRQESNEASLPPPPPDAQPGAATLPPPPQINADAHGNVWSPVVIALAGVLFTPIWSGIMAAINARRLGLGEPIWRPLAVGVGSQAVEFLFGCAGFDFGFIVRELLFTIAPLVALWHLDLSKQQATYGERDDHAGDNWKIPVLAGSPLALLTIVYWGLVLFGPLEPATVVKRFMDSNTAEEARQCCTPNMYGLIDDMSELEKLSGSSAANDELEFDLLDEFYGEFNDNDYRVDYRLKFPASADNPEFVLRGYYFLKWDDGRWQIDDWIVTASSQVPGGMNPVSFSELIEELLRDARRNHPTEDPESGTNSLANLFEYFQKHRFYLVGLIIAIGAIAKAIGRRFG